MSRLDYMNHLDIVRAFDADYLCDMGGELCVAYLDRQPAVKGALEATMSGLHLLKKHRLPFPTGPSPITRTRRPYRLIPVNWLKAGQTVSPT